MQTRMEKYTDAHDDLGFRYKRNEDLYKKISDQELDKYTVKANATVLGDNTPNIDVESVKKLLEIKYNETPKRKSIVIPDELNEEDDEVIETKEYDINLILEKAKEEEKNDYDKDRFKKLRDTQYNILKDLNLSNPSNNDNNDVVEKDELTALINTITQKELENRKKTEESESPLDLFPDLKGDENTVVLEGMKDELGDSLSNNVVKNEIKYIEDEDLDNSFYTTNTQFTQSDFDDFEDLKKEVKGNKILLVIVTIIVIAAILVCIYLLLDNFLGINFFKK